MAKQKTFQTPSGMHDILPSEQYTWKKVYEYAEDIFSFYNFQRIDTPVLEFAELFEKGTGQSSDIVNKEMFTLRTSGGDKLALRPEGTPSIVRAYIQHGMHKKPSPVKLYHAGPMFRHERPQKGRFRQFHQYSIETLGEEDPARDVEVINCFYLLLQKLRIKDVVVEVNSIGDKECRPKYIKALKDYYRPRLKQVCADCRARYKQNPLRILDCKDEKCNRVKQEAPQILDYLCSACNNHFKKVLDILDYVQVPYLLNPHLVRGLDYYTRTVFEIFNGDISEGVDNPENNEKRIALASGGRYDALVKSLGGPDTPAIGGSMGVERVLNLLKKEEKEPQKPAQPKVFLVQIGERAKKKTFTIFEEFRRAGIPVREAMGRGSISSQLKVANKHKVDLTIIMGQQEVLDDVVIIREMDTGAQETIPQEKLVEEIKKRLKKKAK